MQNIIVFTTTVTIQCLWDNIEKENFLNRQLERPLFFVINWVKIKANEVGSKTTLKGPKYSLQNRLMYIVVFWVDLLADGDMLAASNILFLWYFRHLKNWYMSWKSIFVLWNLSQESIISKNVWLILLLDGSNCQAWLLLIKLKSSLIPSLPFMSFLLFISFHNADYRKTIKIIRHLTQDQFSICSYWHSLYVN